MGNTLVKDKTLIEYVPGTPADSGFPGKPAVPERITYEPQVVRYTTGPGTMQRNSDGTWTTPLDVLRAIVNNPGLSAAAAHYSDVWGVVTVGTTPNQRKERVPLSWSGAYVERTEMVRLVVPAQPAIPPRPPTTGSPARSVYDMHLGWNAGGQSLEQLPSTWAGTASFVVGQVVGTVVGFSRVSDVPMGRRGSYASIQFGLVIGDGIVRVREAGVTKGQVAVASSDMQVEATINGPTVEWRVGGTLVHKGAFSMSGPYVLDAVLYSGGDSIDSPSLIEGVAADDGVNLVLPPLRVPLAGDGQGARLELKPITGLFGDPPAQAKLGLAKLQVLDYPLPRLMARLRPARASMSDQAQNGFGDLRLGRLSSSTEMVGGDDTYVPAYSIADIGLLPFVAGATGLNGGVIEAEPRLAAFRMAASQDAYGEARAPLAALEMTADGEPVTPLVRGQILLTAEAQAVGLFYMTIIVGERLGVAGTAGIGAAVIAAGEIERLELSGTAALTSYMVASMLEQIALPDRARAMTFRVDGGVPVLVDEGQAWVVNTGSNATTRYESYSFNSFMSVGGRHFGVRSDGVFLLEGQDDAGAPIEAGIALGKQDFGSTNLKHIDAIYAGVSATGQLYLKVEAPGCSGGPFVYRARRVHGELQQQRFDTGRGLRANYFEFELLNAPGGEFELDNITFNVVSTKRKI